MDNTLKYTEIASYIIDLSKQNGLINGPLAVVPEITEIEKKLFISISRVIKDYTSTRDNSSLTQEEILSMFTFIYAKAAEAVSCWLRHAEFEYKFDGIFDGNVPFTVEENLIDHMKNVKLGETMYYTFMDWVENNPHFCEENEIHPVLPLLEALKWSFRIATNLVIEFFEREQLKGSQSKIQ